MSNIQDDWLKLVDICREHRDNTLEYILVRHISDSVAWANNAISKRDALIMDIVFDNKYLNLTDIHRQNLKEILKDILQYE